MASATSRSAVNNREDFGGSPASTRASVSSWADRGVRAEGLRITAFPPAMAGPILCATRLRGSLKGVIAAMMPSGSREYHPVRSSEPSYESKGMTSPAFRRASAADRRRVLTARSTSFRAWRMVFPASATMVRANSSLRRSMSVAAASRIFPRALRDSARAFRAPARAASSTASPAAGVGQGDRADHPAVVGARHVTELRQHRFRRAQCGLRHVRPPLSWLRAWR